MKTSQECTCSGLCRYCEEVKASREQFKRVRTTQCDSINKKLKGERANPDDKTNDKTNDDGREGEEGGEEEEEGAEEEEEDEEEEDMYHNGVRV